MSAESVLGGEPPPAAGPARPAPRRPWLRRLLWAGAALLAALLLVVLAWVASNWRDAPPQPRPPELQTAAAQLRPADNAALALADLRTPADADPAATAANVLLGARCTRLLDGPRQFEEVTAEPLTMTSPLAPHAMGAVALRDASLAPALQPLLAGWPDATGAARRWLAFESRYMWVAVQSLPDACAAAGRFSWDCISRIGFHTQRTLQAADARWLALYRALDAGLLPVVQQLAQDRQIRVTGLTSVLGMWTELAWRNPYGELMLAITDGAYTGYLLRQADVELCRETTALVLVAQARRVPATERAAWAVQQPLTDTLRARLQWADGGRTLNVRNWQSELPGPQQQAERDAIRITWPN